MTTKTVPVITIYDLYDHDACPEKVELFARTFGDAAPLTAANLPRAQRAGLNIFWAECLLTSPAWEQYEQEGESVWDKYDQMVQDAREAAWRKCEQKRRVALFRALRGCL